MNIELIHGEFSAKDAIDLLTQMIHAKIRFHEAKINKDSNAEDVKMRERRIRQLQKDLYDARKYIDSQGSVQLHGTVDMKVAVVR